jgi:starch-binding outer membrane protein, SusD/RagB family
MTQYVLNLCLKPTNFIQMKRYNKIVAGLMICVICFSSCRKNFLDEEVYSSYAPETLADSLGLEASVVGLHNHLSQFFTVDSRQGWPSVWQVGTDIAFASQQQGIEVPYYNYGSLSSTDDAANTTWQWAYRMINNANIIIANVENPALGGITQAGKNAFNAEARFFRAYAYNTLATLFGRVPITTTPLTAPKTDFVRSSLDSVNNLIVSDLLFATANLPSIDSVKKAGGKSLYARANKAAAMQLLAEAYLRMGKNDLAEQQCIYVLSSGNFNLITSRYGIKASQPGDYFSDMFWYGNQRYGQGNREAIWVMELEHPTLVPGGITNNPQQRRNWGSAYYQIAGMVITDSLGGRGISRIRLSNWVVYRLYETNDIRNSHYNLRRKYWYNDPANPKFGQLVPYVGADTIFRIAPHPTKWYQFDPADVFGYAMIKDFILMRLGETYLLLAEAQFRQGKLNDAAITLNILRARSNASPISAADVTLDFILDERARELLAEENRRMTLMRTGKLVERTIALNSGSVINPVTGLVAPKHLLLPIPQAEIDLNKDAKLEQNPDY